MALAIIARARLLFPKSPDISQEATDLNNALEQMEGVVRGLVEDPSINDTYKRHGIPLKPENLIGIEQKHCSPWVGKFKNFSGEMQDEYYISFTAAEKPIVAKAGKSKDKWIWGSYRERFIDEKVWLERISEIEDHFFPDLQAANAKRAAIEASKSLALSPDLLKNLTLIFGPGGYASNSELGTDWGMDDELPLRMYSFCKKNGARLKKGEKSLCWLDAVDRWIEVGKNGNDYYKKLSKPALRTRQTFRHLTGAVFAGFQVNEVSVLAFMEWLKGRGAAIKDVYAPQIVKSGTVVEPGFLKVLSASGEIEFYLGGFPFSESIVDQMTGQFRSFISFCSQPWNGWCAPIPSNFKRFVVHEKPQRENMTLDQFEGTLRWFFFYGLKGSVPMPGDATYAANIVMRSLGGPRKAEAYRSSGSNVSDGLLTLNDKEKIKVNARATRMVPLFQFLHNFLENWKTETSPKGHWQDENLSLPEIAEDTILYLAGWESNNKQVIERAERYLKFCAEHAIAIPQRGQKDPAGGKDEFGFDKFISWGPFPRNGFRHLALSMYYKLYFDPDATAIWGGTSDGMLDDWYLSAFDLLGHRFSLGDVKRYWLSIPDLDFIPKLKDQRAKLITKGWGLKRASGSTLGLPPGHALDGFIEPELQVIMDEVKAETGQLEINPYTIEILSKKLEDQQAKAEKLIQERNEWSETNPNGNSTEFPGYNALKQSLKMVQIYRARLAAADQGVCYASETNSKNRDRDKRAPVTLRAQWPSFLGWLKSLPHGGISQFAKALKLCPDTVGKWVRFGRVPLESVMKLAFATASEGQWGYKSDVEYTPRRIEPTGAELLQWRSFVAWAKEQGHGFPRSFGMSLGLSASCVTAWMVGVPSKGFAPAIPSPEVMASVFQKASQVGWVYGIEPKPRYDRARWQSLVNWIKTEAAKRHGFIAGLARQLGIKDANVHNWLNGGRPSSARLHALEAYATSVGWVPYVQVEVLTREQFAIAEAAKARLEAEGKELEERMLLEKLLMKYPDMGQRSSQRCLRGAFTVESFPIR